MISTNDINDDSAAELFLAAAKRYLVYSKDKIFIKDKNLIYRGVSRKFANMAGWGSEQDLVGKTDFEIFQDQELAQRYRDDDLKLIDQQRDLLNYVEPITEKNGHARFAATSKFVLTDENGQFLGLVGFSRDITKEYYLKRHSNKALEYLFDLPSNAYFAAYLDLDEWRIINEYHQSVDGNEFGFHSQIDVLISRAYEGIADRRWPAATFYRDFSKETITDLYESGKREIVMEYRRSLRSGEIRWIRDEIHLLQDNVSGHLCMMLVTWDIHAAKLEGEERLRMAERDELTGLLNRKATMQLIQERLDSSFEDDKHALLMIDADYFKLINDTYGHQAGDKVLTELAKEISSSFRVSDIVGRIGGDEFFVLMTRVLDRNAVEKKMEMLLSKIKSVHYKDIYISASIGVSIFPSDSRTLEEMYSMADRAMYAAKKTRGRVVFAEDISDLC